MNPLIDLLATYGPSAASDSLCDENVDQAEKLYSVESIKTHAPRLEDLYSELLAGVGRNVILTGTAGDGKTYHIRRLLEKHFPTALTEWPGREGVLRIEGQDGYQYRIIRDLSEISDSEKEAEISTFTSALLGESPKTIYLVAANDGQLLKYFRDASNGPHEEAARFRAVYVELTEMLRGESEESEKLSLRLMNLSRSWSATTVEAILDGVLTHNGWDEGCQGCAYATGDKICPIRLNRSLLLPVDGEQPLFRVRLVESLRLAAANDQHVPIRQLLTLSVNILLGDSKNANKPLLNCAEAKKRADRSEYRFTNPYNNAVGSNLRPERRRANRVFSVFEVLGIGLETNNLIDSVLVHGKPKDIHNQLFDTELVYGRQIFDPLHQEYLGGGGKPEAVRNFRTGLEAQRRRAFFRLQESENIESTSPWRLTIFHHGGQYLQLLDALEDGRRRELVDRYTRQLVRGLNRALTGMMAMEDNKLWLAGTIGKTDDPAGRVSTTEGIERGSFQGLSLKLKLDPIKRRPTFQVLPPPYMKEAKMPELDLRPLLFEYLMRVAGGSLPASFSRQCHQEIRHYALVATASITRLLQQPEEDGLHVVHMLSLGNQGEVQPHRIEI